jgi:transcription elongation factor S-II
MSDAGELKKLVKQLQSTSTDEEIIVILKTLKTDYQINEAILRESKAGLAVGKLRSHASKGVADLAKEIVKKWKTEVEKAKTGPSNKTGVNGKAQSRKPSMTPTPATPTSANSSKGSKERSAQTDGVDVDLTGDKTRDKCVELIYNALASDSGAPSHLILTRARGIEENVLSIFGGTNSEYRGKIRTLFVNLKDQGNPGLRENVVSGEISVEKFSRMTSQVRRVLIDLSAGIAMIIV